MLQLFFLKTSYWQWVVLRTEVILGMKDGSGLVQNQLRSQSLHPKMRDTTKIMGLNAMVPKQPMTRGATIPAPVKITGVDAKMLRLAPARVISTRVDATMLQLGPAPVMDTGVNTTIHPESEDDCKANVRIYQSPLTSGEGKGCDTPMLAKIWAPLMTPAIIDPGNVNLASLLYKYTADA